MYRWTVKYVRRSNNVLLIREWPACQLEKVALVNNLALLHGETSHCAHPNTRFDQIDGEVSQSHAQGDPQYSARTLFALSHSEYPFHCRRERSFDRKHPRVSQDVREASSVIAGVVENTAPQAGNIVRNDVIDSPEYLKGNLTESFTAPFPSTCCYGVIYASCNLPRDRNADFPSWTT